MRLTKARSELNRILAALRRWETDTPQRARRFHSVRRELEAQVSDSLTSWWPWLGDEVIERYRDRMRLLDGVADALTSLIANAERLENEVRGLLGSLSASDPDVAAWMSNVCREWVATLGRLGTVSDRLADLRVEEAVLSRIETSVRLHDEALRELREVARIVRAVGDLRAIPVIGVLPDLRRRLYDEGPSAAWLAEIRGAAEPLRTIADRVIDPPRELRSLTQALTDARGWSIGLRGEGQDELEQLEERQFRAAELEQAEVDELIAAANALRARLTALANERRHAKLTELRAQLSDLRQSCGPKPALDSMLAALEDAPIDHPSLYRNWLDEASRFAEQFAAIAHTHIGEIEARLFEAAARLVAELDELESQPLSHDIRKDATLLRRDLMQLPQASTSEEMLRDLRRMAEISQSIATLAARAEHDVQDVARRQQQLSQRYELLQESARRVRKIDFDPSDLSERIGELHERSIDASLEERRRQIDELAVALDELEAQFVERCRQAIEKHDAAMMRSAQALRVAGIATVEYEIRQLAPGATLHDATEMVLGTRVRHEAVLKQAREVAKLLEKSRVEKRAAIATLPTDDLGPADRQSAMALLQELDGGAWSEARAFTDRLEALARLVGRCDAFFDRLQQEQHSAEERRSDLQQRLRAFNEDQLSRFCPELTERVTALLYGIPEHPRQWASVHHQLDVASELFNRIEVQARRLAADEVERARKILEERVERAPMLSYRSAREMLTELAATNHETLAPGALRLRIVSAAQRRG